MKKAFSIICSTLLSITLLAQVDIKEINKSLAKVDDKLYASKYEVSNKLYMTFLNSLKQSNKTNLLTIAQIDTLKWTESVYNLPYVYHYHAHTAYHNFPLVNVSYEGATLYCEWLTEQYNAHPKRKFKKVVFRLPTEEEWLISAQGGNDSAIYPLGGKKYVNKEVKFLYNYNDSTYRAEVLWLDGNYIDNDDATAPVKAYWPNGFGLYNMSGNVSEMIVDKGVTKGGSWKDGAEYLKIGATCHYDGKPQPNVGFRYFAEVLER